MNNSQEGVSSTGWQPNHASLDNEVYRFLVSYYLHQDKLSWSRTQALVVAEAGLLAASFANCYHQPVDWQRGYLVDLAVDSKGLGD